MEKVGDKMGMVFDINIAPGYLDVSATGEFSLEEAKRTFLELVDAIVRHKYDRVVVDGRKIKGEPRFIERFYYGEFVAQTVKKVLGTSSINTKFAYILVEPVLDPERFGETVAINRGMNVKVFDNTDDAFGWLELDNPKP